MANFFERQRKALGVKSQRAMAARIGCSNEAVRQWESDGAVPSTPIKQLAASYQVTENTMEREVMALRRRMEAKTETAAAK
jgi:transcriptional regulator with XRE-family HTH domain